MRYAEHFAPSGRLQQRTHRMPLKKRLEFMKKSIMNMCIVIALCVDAGADAETIRTLIQNIK